MPLFESSSISSVAVHRVGNKETDEGYVLSSSPLPLSDALQDLLIQYFISPFKVEEYYHLCEDQGVELNEIRHLAADLFDDPDQLMEISRQTAKRLYDACTHPNIKGGDLFVAYFKGVQLNGETLDAIGLFKSETTEPFLKVSHDDEEWSRQEGDRSAGARFRLDIEKGINIHKLDKGALIFNCEAEKGYVVSVVDATNRSMDAVYWKDNFLHLCQRQDEYYNTHEVMQAYKKFVTDELPQQFETSKADQADLLNKSVQFFKQNESFDMDDFTRDVIGQAEVIDSFQQYRKQYESENDVTLPDQFDISEGAVKKQARAYKSVIKLDKNFHIYVHGDRNLIEQGEDEKGKYYKVYFKEES